ncbi:MAG: hypothetical protein NTU49_10895 [Gammaproteobacteria bacterium]|nr:hypothetical protein [Gammaproteobacteria bacterium]
MALGRRLRDTGPDDVLEAFNAVMEAAYSAGIDASEIKIKIDKLISAEANYQFVKSVLIRYLNK